MLEKAGIAKRAFAPAMISGFELVVAPYANLVESGDGVVYGILANVTHKELEQLYGTHRKKLTDIDYFPEAVLVQTRGGKIVAATVYIAAAESTGTPDKTYINLMKKAASDYGFPQWYQDRIAAFAE